MMKKDEGENSLSLNKVWSSLLREQQMCFDQQSRKLGPDEKSNNVVLRGTCTSHLEHLFLLVARGHH